MSQTYRKNLSQTYRLRVLRVRRCKSPHIGVTHTRTSAPETPRPSTDSIDPLNCPCRWPTGRSLSRFRKPRRCRLSTSLAAASRKRRSSESSADDWFAELAALPSFRFRGDARTRPRVRPQSVGYSCTGVQSSLHGYRLENCTATCHLDLRDIQQVYAHRVCLYVECVCATRACSMCTCIHVSCTRWRRAANHGEGTRSPSSFPTGQKTPC